MPVERTPLRSQSFSWRPFVTLSNRRHVNICQQINRPALQEEKAYELEVQSWPTWLLKRAVTNQAP
jgi:hypothetical protein